MLLLPLAAGGLTFATSPATPTPGPGVRGPVQSAAGWLRALPVAFEPNRGQAPRGVRYLARDRGFTGLVGDRTLALLLHPPTAASVLQRRPADGLGILGGAPRPAPNHPIRVSLGFGTAYPAPGASPVIEPGDRLPGSVSIFHGGSAPLTGIPRFGRLDERGIAPGIDLSLRAAPGGGLEYSFRVAAGIDPSAIRVRVSGGTIRLEPDGRLLVDTAAGPLAQPPPLAYQQRGAMRMRVPARFLPMGGDAVGFAVGAYDPSLPLVIDPVLRSATYLGGNGMDVAYSAAVDGSGDGLVAGYTESANFPARGSFQTDPGGGDDAFVARFRPNGDLVYSAYLGGSEWERSFSLTTDGRGDAFVTGYSQSADFPTTPGAYQASLKGTTNAFVTEIDPSGSRLVFSTYLGGSAALANQPEQFDIATGIATDATGHVFLAGETDSIDFPTTQGAVQPAYRGGTADGFVSELDPSGSSLVFSTYLGGEGYDLPSGVGLDASGDVFAGGETNSPDFPTTVGAFQFRLGGRPPFRFDGFVARLGPDGTSLRFATYVGGSLGDYGDALAVDAAGDAFLTGETESQDFPTTAGAYQTQAAGYNDAFVTKLDPTGATAVFSTYLGATDYDGAFDLGLDRSGSVWVTGYTASRTFPITGKAFQPTYPGAALHAAFVTRLAPDGAALAFSSYLGGPVVSDAGYANEAYSLALGPRGAVWVAGLTISPGFPLAGHPFQPTVADPSGDAFLVKMGPGTARPVSVRSDGFAPSTVRVRAGGTVQWTIDPAAGPATLADQTGLGLFDPLDRPAGSIYAFRFPVAGAYSVVDQSTGQAGAVLVTMTVSPRSAGAGTPLRVGWASGGVPPGMVVDVQIETPATSGFEPWRTGTRATSTSFIPGDGPGVYRFRARLRRAVSGLSSGWSPGASVRVG